MKAKRLLAAIVALCILIVAWPSNVTALEIKEFIEAPMIIVKFEDSPTTGKDIYDAFLENTNSSLPESSVTPLGNRPVTLYEAAEIFTWRSWNNAMQDTDIYVPDRASTDVNNTYKTYTFREKTPINHLENESVLNALCYATGVAFDPTGCGRRNHVAILGFHNTGSKDTSKVYVYVINGDLNRVVGQYVLDSGNMWWLLNDTGEAQLDNVDSANFFQITAGDYDNDGKDTLIVYDGTPKLRELKVSISAAGQASITKVADNLHSDSTPYLNKSYMMVDSAGNRMYNSGINYRLGVSLETGDVNGDGIDDLVVVSCTGDYPETSTYYEYRKNEPCKATLAVGLGQSGGSLSNAEVLTGTIYDSSTSMTVAAAGVSVGDIDADGTSEIVVAGFLNKSTADDKVNMQNGKVGFTYYRINSGKLTQINGLQQLSDISGISKGDSLRKGNGNKNGDEPIWQQFSVECVSFDGLNTQDYIFLNGYVYQLNNKVPQHVSIKGGYYNSTKGTPEMFESLTGDWNFTSDDFDEVFIMSAAVGNFSGSTTGEESVFLTVGYKLHGKNEYCIAECLVEKADEKLVCRVQKDAGAPVEEGLYMSSKKYAGADGLSYIHVAIDVGYDSCVAQYQYSEAFYSDPTVVAFLQAAPYFSELGAGNSSTTYSYSETYEDSVTSGFSFAVGVGIAASLESSAVKFEVEEAVSTGISTDFTQSLSREYTTVFEANGENQVVLRRMLMCTYYYARMDQNGNYDTDPDHLIAITVPQNPCISTLSVEQYNAYADYYNKQCSQYQSQHSIAKYFQNTLQTVSGDLLEKYYLNNEGNPFMYANSGSAYANSITMVQDNTWLELGHAGGTGSQEYSYAAGTEDATCSSIGVEVNMKIMAGASFAGNGAYAGVSASMESVTSNTKTTSQLRQVGTGGTVQNLDADQTAYGFQWQLIGWKAEADDNLFNNDVLFVGYLVKDVKAPPEPVTNLSASYPGNENGELVLTWTAPTVSDGRTDITHFAIYENGKLIKMVSNTGAGKEQSFAIDVSEYTQSQVTYYVLSSAIVTSGSASYNVYSIPSNAVQCALAMTEKQVRELVDAAIADLNSGLEGLKDALGQKANQTALDAAIRALTDAYENADTIVRQYTDTQVTDLREEMDGMRKDLVDLINSLQLDLEQKLETLTKLMATGDTENADNLTSAIEQLTAQYKKADQLLQSELCEKLQQRDDALSAQLEKVHTALTEQLQASDRTLSESIDNVKRQLEKAIEDLNSAITSGDQDNAAALAEAFKNLSASCEQANALAMAGIDTLSTDMAQQLAKLKSELSAAQQALQAGVDALQEKLDLAVLELKNAIAAGDQENADELAETIRLLTEAYVQADEKLKGEIDDLKLSNEALKAEIEALKQQLAAQDEQLGASKTVATAGLVIASISLMGVAAASACIIRQSRRISTKI